MRTTDITGVKKLVHKTANTNVHGSTL